MSPPDSGDEKPGAMRRLRSWLLAGLLVLAPSVLTLWVFYRLLNFVDNILGRFLRFSFFDYRRIPGLGLLATLILLAIVGAIARRFGAGPLGRLWDRLLTRIPGVGILYGSTKSLGEALLSPGERAFQKVVLVAWPYPGVYRVGFVTGRAPADLRRRIGEEIEVVFVPHTPNPASGFVHYVPKSQVIYLDWPVEEGLKVIVSGGVVQPPARA
ncbi:MAG: DUF502 domain-containing protein [Candidatus Eisenbacteria bacterium]|nr:DUF502 domain-containing protein [Candidatus Eisenbacteria bacterium]